MLKRIGMALLATVLTGTVSFAQVSGSVGPGPQVTPEQKQGRDTAIAEWGAAFSDYSAAISKYNLAVSKAKRALNLAGAPPYAGCVIPGNANNCWFYWTFYRTCLGLCINSISGPHVSKTNGWFYKYESDEAAAADRATTNAKYKADRCTTTTEGTGTLNTYFFTCSVYGPSGGGVDPYQ